MDIEKKINIVFNVVLSVFVVLILSSIYILYKFDIVTGEHNINAWDQVRCIINAWDQVRCIWYDWPITGTVQSKVGDRITMSWYDRNHIDIFYRSSCEIIK